MPHFPSRRAFLAGATVFVGGAKHLMSADALSTKPARQPNTRKDVPPQMSFLANDQIKIGIDLALGGAITHLSPAKEPDKNVVNSWDLGRQIQMSYYSGPVPYRVEGHAGPPDAWKHIGWNPIQVGDDYGNPSRILEHRNDGKALYVKCIPMQWPLDNVPGECTFECWITLEGAAAHVRCKLTMKREDKTQWPARTQELPAVYTNGPWHRLFTYAGEKPFTGDALKQIEHPFTATSPWAHWSATERWAALLDEKDWGLGIWNPDAVRFSGGFAGNKGRGGPKDSPTGYISPNRAEILDHNAEHSYGYALLLGDLKSIRDWVVARSPKLQPPNWSFDQDRQGWTYHNATDTGWPIKGELNVKLHGHNPQLISSAATWTADSAGQLVIEAAFTGPMKQASVFWATVAEPAFAATRRVSMPLIGDGVMRTYKQKLADHVDYKGLITQIRIDPLETNETSSARVKAVRLVEEG